LLVAYINLSRLLTTSMRIDFTDRAWVAEDCKSKASAWHLFPLLRAGQLSSAQAQAANKAPAS